MSIVAFNSEEHILHLKALEPRGPYIKSEGVVKKKDLLRRYIELGIETNRSDDGYNLERDCILNFCHQFKDDENPLLKALSNDAFDIHIKFIRNFDVEHPGPLGDCMAYEFANTIWESKGNAFAHKWDNILVVGNPEGSKMVKTDNVGLCDYFFSVSGSKETRDHRIYFRERDYVDMGEKLYGNDVSVAFRNSARERTVLKSLEGYKSRFLAKLGEQDMAFPVNGFAYYAIVIPKSDRWKGGEEEEPRAHLKIVALTTERYSVLNNTGNFAELFRN